MPLRSVALTLALACGFLHAPADTCVRATQPPPYTVHPAGPDRFVLSVGGYSTWGSTYGEFCALGLSWTGSAITEASAARVISAVDGGTLLGFQPNATTRAAFAALLPGSSTRGFLAPSGLVAGNEIVDILITLETPPATTLAAVIASLAGGGIGTDKAEGTGALTGNLLQVFRPATVNGDDTGSAGGTRWSQSVDGTTIVPGSASCTSSTAGTYDTGFWRVYDPVAQGAGGGFDVNACRFGVESATSATGSQLVRVQLFANIGPGAPIAGPELGSTYLVMNDATLQDQRFETAVFNPPVRVPAETFVAVRVSAYNGQPQGDFFFIGSNPLGETPPMSSYVSAPDCGFPTPIPYASAGFPSVHAVIDLETSPAHGPIGTSYCPNVPNSTGLSATLSATGFTSAAAMDVLLTAGQLPPNQFGFFFASRTQGLVALPGNTSGFLCVVGNPGRYDAPGQVGNSGPGGTISLQVGGINVPTNPAPGEALMAGDTWNWQLWYRDVALSNFSDALSITFN